MLWCKQGIDARTDRQRQRAQADWIDARADLSPVAYCACGEICLLGVIGSRQENRQQGQR